MPIITESFRFQIWHGEQQRFQGQPLIATTLTRDFFDAPTTRDGPIQAQMPPPIATNFYNPPYTLSDRFGQASSSANGTEKWTDEFSAIERQVHGDTEWVKDFEEHQASEGRITSRDFLSN